MHAFTIGILIGAIYAVLATALGSALGKMIKAQNEDVPDRAKRARTLAWKDEEQLEEV